METNIEDLIKAPFKSENENFEFDFQFSNLHTGTLRVTFLSDNITMPYPFSIFKIGNKDYITIEHIVIFDVGNIQYQINQQPLSEVIYRLKNELVDIRPQNL